MKALFVDADGKQKTGSVPDVPGPPTDFFLPTRAELALPKAVRSTRMDHYRFVEFIAVYRAVLPEEPA